MNDVARRVIAIDGSSGSGKSTVGRAVAEALDLKVLDTGAMYRAITLAVLDAGHALDDEDAAVDLATRTAIEVEDGVTRLDGRDVSQEIRGPEVTASVSVVSAHPRVRKVLVAQQRAWVDGHGGGVVEGRDIGTVVFPDAAVKVHLLADDTERARRRQRDERAANRQVDLESVQDALVRRDSLDSGRAAAPLRVADDAVVIDTTSRTVADIAAEIVERFRVTE
ncbi:MAG: (d)CMP kinase [Acidimicrobiia bacterium]